MGIPASSQPPAHVPAQKTATPGSTDAVDDILLRIAPVENDAEAWAAVTQLQARGVGARALAKALNDRGYRLLNTDNQPSRALPFFEKAAVTDRTYGMPRYSAAKCSAAVRDLSGILRHLGELKALGRGQRARLMAAKTRPGFRGVCWRRCVPGTLRMTGVRILLLAAGLLAAQGDDGRHNLGRYGRAPGPASRGPAEDRCFAKQDGGRSSSCYLMSGARKGDESASMHSQALAVDVTIDDMDSEGVASELRAVGFTCVTTYYNSKRRPCFMAHADLRGTNVAWGAYARGGRKADNCPPIATSKTESCANDKKAQWVYWRRKPW